MGSKENIGHAVGGKRAINGLSLTYKIFPSYQIIIYQGKQEMHKNLLINTITTN